MCQSGTLNAAIVKDFSCIYLQIFVTARYLQMLDKSPLLIFHFVKRNDKLLNTTFLKHVYKKI